MKAAKSVRLECWFSVISAALPITGRDWIYYHQKSRKFDLKVKTVYLIYYIYLFMLKKTHANATLNPKSDHVLGR